VGLTPDDKYVKIAVDKSSSKNMRKFGNSYAYKGTFLAPTNTEKPESYKIRKGKTGNFQEELSSEDIEYINNVASIILPGNKEILKWN
jgi:hypothetical protein